MWSAEPSSALSALLLRHGRRYPGRLPGARHWSWLLQQVMEHPASRSYSRNTWTQCSRPATGAAPHRPDPGAHASLVPGAFRRRLPSPAGGLPYVATTVVAEVGDLNRFRKPKELMAYLSLVPSEHSAAPRCAEAVSPKLATAMPAGSGGSRLGLPLASRVTRLLLQRQEGLPESIRQIAWKAQLRLCARYRRFLARGKAKQTIVTAIARELVALSGLSVRL